MFETFDVVKIYMTLQLRLTKLITRCNFLNIWIKSIETKEELMSIDYNSELPMEYQEQVDNIVDDTQNNIQSLIDKYSDNSIIKSDEAIEENV